MHVNKNYSSTTLFLSEILIFKEFSSNLAPENCEESDLSGYAYSLDVAFLLVKLTRVTNETKHKTLKT